MVRVVCGLWFVLLSHSHARPRSSQPAAANKHRCGLDRLFVEEHTPPSIANVPSDVAKELLASPGSAINNQQPILNQAKAEPKAHPAELPPRSEIIPPTPTSNFLVLEQMGKDTLRKKEKKTKKDLL